LCWHLWIVSETFSSNCKVQFVNLFIFIYPRCSNAGLNPMDIEYVYPAWTYQYDRFGREKKIMI
jgi:hypothetical protein